MASVPDIPPPVCHPGTPFLLLNPLESPFYKPEYKAKFDAVREITSTKRPGGHHGCPLVEIVSGVWTCHFEDISQPNAFETLPITPPVGLVVNIAVAHNQCPTYTGFYGPNIQVLPIDLFDDPKVGEAHTVAGDAGLHFAYVNQFIRKTRGEGKSVVVHCMASLSRSIAFLIAYLMEDHGMSIESATALIKSKWDATWPNDSFVFQLIEYEEKLLKQKEKSIE